MDRLQTLMNVKKREARIPSEWCVAMAELLGQQCEAFAEVVVWVITPINEVAHLVGVSPYVSYMCFETSICKGNL